MQRLTRNFFLFLANNQSLNRLAKKHGGSFAQGKIIGGHDFLSAIPYIKQLNENGLLVTVDHLGEFVDSVEVTKERTKECIEALEFIHKEQLHSHVSVKLTSLGLDISKELALENMIAILDVAEKYNIMVTIDMEDVPRCQPTIDIFKELKIRYSCISTVLQAYLYRTEQDLKDLSQYKPFIRLVKGAYKEDPKDAFPNKKYVDENYKKLIRQSFEYGIYPAIATHDDQMIRYTKKLAQELNISKNQFEFQFLYGMRTELQLQLVREGYKVRVYLPYGQDWYGYFMRRLAERPANISFAFKGLIKK